MEKRKMRFSAKQKNLRRSAENEKRKKKKVFGQTKRKEKPYLS
jgi:hypothetical protein